MIKRKNNKLIQFFYILIIGIEFSFGFGCNNVKKGLTPPEYIYNDTVDIKTYSQYKLTLVDSIRSFIRYKDGPYYRKEFDEQTIVFVDTILFSPKRNRITFFVITKNSNDKLLSKGNKNEYHYDANCFIGNLKIDSIWDIRWLKALNLTRYDTHIESSERIREMYFTLFSTIKDVDGNSLYKYNLNDIRFWDGPIWQKYFEN
jgi:hypothetical protein